jgi:hypothetical protein
LKHHTDTQNFEDFEEEIDAIMSGNGSKGSRDYSKGSRSNKKGFNKRSNTVHVSNSSNGGSEHKNSKFFQSKKSLKFRNKNFKSSNSTGYKLNGSSNGTTNYTGSNYSKFSGFNSAQKGHRRMNTNHYYQVNDIKEVSEDEDERSENNHLTPMDNETIMSAISKTCYSRGMEEFSRHRRYQSLSIPNFGNIKSMACLNK